ncbi:methyltransferase [Aliidiomarina quisquiliarum]|uniref:methyltransferase n=1 Tax=Aliidiomarina quisquiliarum TaxID=2938947 RepID=UPI00208E4E0C|nr:methyltransferase [Aliidiomarina quisquiliarum]MCO4321594.1 methyltransferase [Aliidiomarina quisquiliarum]
MVKSNKSSLSAVEAKSRAQWIAFGPVVFYATVAMRDTGLLQAVADAGRSGADLASLAAATELSEYSTSVLLDFATDLNLVSKSGDYFILDKVGHFILHDKMTEVNMNFTRDVCYQGLPFLEEALRTQTPAGLKTLGPWDNIYEGLTEQPEPAKSSWFSFDHYYSDQVFDALLPIVFEHPVRELLDVGGNTGRWALKCLAYNPQVKITLMDLPSQLAVAKQNIEAAGYGERVHYHPTNLLDEAQPFYQGADTIWMSQFLDCFSAEDIVSILRRTAASMDTNTTLYIIENFPDRQAFEAASFSINATSLYFTCIANGNSRMYYYQQFKQLIEDAGLRITQEIDDVGVGHTVLRCQRA